MHTLARARALPLRPDPRRSASSSRPRPSSGCSRQGFDVDSLVLPMPSLASPEAFVAPAPPPRDGARVLWVGRISPEKRPELFLDLARACPELQIRSRGPGRRRSLRRWRRAPRAGPAQRDRARGDCPRKGGRLLPCRRVPLCSTSEFEGFPNTFLEAWAQGVPVVSTFDPDGLIERRGLGRAVAKAEDLAAALRDLLSRRGGLEGDVSPGTAVLRGEPRRRGRHAPLRARVPGFGPSLQGGEARALVTGRTRPG